MSIFGNNPTAAESRRKTLRVLCRYRGKQGLDADAILDRGWDIKRSDLSSSTTFFGTDTPEFKLRRAYHSTREQVRRDLTWLRKQSWANDQPVGGDKAHRWLATAAGRKIDQQHGNSKGRSRAG